MLGATSVAPVIQVPVVRLDPELTLPGYAHDGDAGLDLYARIDAVVPARGGRLLVPTGIAIALPEGYAGLVLPRSGLALRHGVTVANAPGLIDCGYRGELQVILLNTDPVTDFHVVRGHRIAQLVVQAVEQVGWLPMAELPADTTRGTGGFGHSGH
jgi:dUTP pyrophosphatase